MAKSCHLTVLCFAWTPLSQSQSSPHSVLCLSTRCAYVILTDDHFCDIFISIPYVISVFVCRSEMTKIFPSDSEPPEETVELWTGGKAQQQQQQQQRLAESRQQKLLRLLRCISEHTDPREAATAISASSPSTKSRLNDLFASLLCLQSGTCTDSPVETSVVQMLQCYEPQCSESCVDADNFPQCVAACIQPNGEKFLHSILKRRASHRSLKRMVLNDLYDTLNKMETRGRQDLNLSRGLPKRSEDLDGMSIAKRYRLGLYDCISSYCGQLSGADRKSCIINYCHRSTTIKM